MRPRGSSSSSSDEDCQRRLWTGRREARVPAAVAVEGLVPGEGGEMMGRLDVMGVGRPFSCMACMEFSLR